MEGTLSCVVEHAKQGAVWVRPFGMPQRNKMAPRSFLTHWLFSRMTVKWSRTSGNIQAKSSAECLNLGHQQHIYFGRVPQESWWMKCHFAEHRIGFHLEKRWGNGTVVGKGHNTEGAHASKCLSSALCAAWGVWFYYLFSYNAVLHKSYIKNQTLLLLLLLSLLIILLSNCDLSHARTSSKLMMHYYQK